MLPSANFAPLLALLATAAPALSQSDVWVDPTFGSDSATGLSASDPWKTLTYATSTATAGSTVHLLPGRYSIASREVFPILMDHPLSIVGEGDAADIVLDGLGAGSVFNMLMVDTSGAVNLSRFTMDGQGEGAGLLWLKRADCQVTDVHLYRGTTGFQSRARSTVVLDGCSASDCSFVGARAYDSPMTIRDSTFTDCGFAGVAVLHSFDARDIELHLLRCRVEGNDGDGVYLSSPNVFIDTPVTVADSIIADNAGGGTCGDFIAQANLARDGSLDPAGGNLSGDPRFIDAAARDYRLRFDSPCIDAAQPGASSVDLNGRPRVVDGDLDLLSAADMGSYEHHTLSGPTEAIIGDSLTLFVSGPQNGFSSVIVSHAGYAPTGAAFSNPLLVSIDG